MEAVIEKNTYKISHEESENITKQLDEAIKHNKENPQTRIWNSKEYRKKYDL